MSSVSQISLKDLWDRTLYSLELNSVQFDNTLEADVIKSVMDETIRDIMTRIDLNPYVTLEEKRIDQTFLDEPELDLEHIFRLSNSGNDVFVETSRTPSARFNVYSVANLTEGARRTLDNRPRILSIDDDRMKGVAGNLYYMLQGNTFHLYHPWASAAEVPDWNWTLQIGYIRDGWLHSLSSVANDPVKQVINISPGDTKFNDPNYGTFIPESLIIGGVKWRWLRRQGREFQSWFTEYENLIQQEYRANAGGSFR